MTKKEPQNCDHLVARIDRIDTRIARGLDYREKAAVRVADAMEKPVATYFGLDDADSAEFCLWLVEYLLQDAKEHPHE